MIACVRSGASGKDAPRPRRRRCWMRSRPVVLRKGATPGMRYDAGKKVKGRKRHLVVDTLGLLLAVSVTAASLQDRDGAHPVIATAMAKHPSVETLLVDSGYAGRCAQTVSQRHDIEVQVTRHPANKNVGRWIAAGQSDLFTVQPHAQGFVLLAKPWVVERTHA
jgi:transposase